MFQVFPVVNGTGRARVCVGFVVVSTGRRPPEPLDTMNWNDNKYILGSH